MSNVLAPAAARGGLDRGVRCARVSAGPCAVALRGADRGVRVRRRPVGGCGELVHPRRRGDVRRSVWRRWARSGAQQQPHRGRSGDGQRLEDRPDQRPGRRVRAQRRLARSACDVRCGGRSPDPFGITIDPASGDVYVSDSTGIARYVSDGQPTPTYTVDNTFTVTGVAGALAFDAGNDQVLRRGHGDQHRQALREPRQQLPARRSTDRPAPVHQAPSPACEDLAVKANGDVVVVDASGDPADSSVISRVERYASNGVWQATIGPVDGAATVAVLPTTDEVVVLGQSGRGGIWTSPSLFVFDADTTSRQLELNGGDDGASTTWSTVSGLAAGAGSSVCRHGLQPRLGPGRVGTREHPGTTARRRSDRADAALPPACR